MKDCHFSENTAKEEGGAIMNDYELEISQSTFNENMAKKGGAIFNTDILTINDSTFTKNIARDKGGAICHDEHILYRLWVSIHNSEFHENKAKAGGAIHHIAGDSTISHCVFLANESKKHIILNSDALKINSCEFNKNKSKYVISNEGNFSHLNVCHSGFIENEWFGLKHDGKVFKLEKCIFKDNASGDIENLKNMTLKSPEINDDKKTIYNSGHIYIENPPEGIEDNISGPGSFETQEKSSTKGPKLDFGYLDKKIHEKHSSEIILNEDILLEMYEENDYESGINLDIDNLTIDGNGHTINARGKACIFLITSRNITLKNIIFKKGYVKNLGAAINITKNAKVKIENCQFLENENGGAIKNNGKLTILKSTFKDNRTRTINNFARLSMSKCNLNNNPGGGIYNEGTLKVENCEFIKNSTPQSKIGAAILNSEDGKLTVSESKFMHNTTKDGSGGAIYNIGKDNIRITNSSFIENIARNGSGGAIYLKSSGDWISISDCDYEKNIPNSIATSHRVLLEPTSRNHNLACKTCTNEFEDLNTTTKSIYDLGKHKVLIILKDGTNLTDWSDVENKSDIIYVIEDLSDERSLYGKYENLTQLRLAIVQNASNEILSVDSMFSGCESLIGVFGFETWDTSNLKSMENMFGECSSLIGLTGLESLDVSNVEDMTAVFVDCKNLKDLDALNDWDTSNVRNMWSMFAGCESLKYILALKNWNTSNVENMNSMFTECRELKDLYAINQWDVSKVRNFGSLFCGCKSLSDISGLENWNTSNVSKLSGAFWECESLEDISLLGNWDTSNVKEMTYTFLKCKSLRDLTPLRSWNVKNVDNMRSMFDSCPSIESLDGLESWRLKNISTVEKMFDGCHSLKDVSALESWTIPNSVNSGSIFNDCPKVKKILLKRKSLINTSH